MIINEEFNENSLLKFYYSCPLFKKYCKEGLWFGSFEEYENIKYCEKYLRKYTYTFLQNNKLFKSGSLNLDPYFKKFIKSGFFRHINSHFLKAFFGNSFLFSFPKSKLKIEKFVENYFHIYLKEKLEKELLVSLIKSMYRFTFIILSKNELDFSLEKNLCSKSNKEKDIQILFESNTFFDTFNDKKRVLEYIKV